MQNTYLRILAELGKQPRTTCLKDNAFCTTDLPGKTKDASSQIVKIGCRQTWSLTVVKCLNYG